MCGGDLNVTEGLSVVECEYCGSRQTIPSQDNEKKLTLFARADRLRRACEFDKAAGVYESLVADFPEEAEAYWGLVLCRYGIEYVDDPATGKKVPTCHRSSFDSILEDADFDQACENADAIARRQYREEAKTVEGIRRGILEVSSKEEPYDIFICYKETDETGGRTIDSVIAQDVYDALTEKGYRVFFSRVSLEDKLGTEYEPYIFAALNSAKVMLAFGTDFEYFNAVWVKNEWSRFLALMAAGQKKTLIPCYKNLDAYDMPKEFQRLQAQDMGKVGAIQDLLRGIGKIIPREKEVVEKTVVVQQSAAPVPTAPGVESLLKRGWMFLADQDWAKADEYFDKVLDIDPENARAYSGKMCAGLKEPSLNDIAKKLSDMTKLKIDSNFQKADRFADSTFRVELEQCLKSVKENQKRREEMEERRRKEEKRRQKEEEARKKAEAERRRKEEEARRKEEEERRRQEEYAAACADQERASTSKGYTNAAEHLEALGDYQDSAARAEICRAEAERHRILEEKQAKEQAAKIKKFSIIGCTVAAAALVIGIVFTQVIIPQVIIPGGKYRDAEALLVSGDMAGAAAAFGDLGDYRDAQERKTALLDEIADGKYQAAEALLVSGNKAGAAIAFNGLGNYRDARERSMALWDEGAQRDTIAAGSWHTVGLKADGTVVAVGSNMYGQCNVSGWTDIVAVAAGNLHTVGLKADGTVVAVGSNMYGQCNVSGWTDIVAVAAENLHTVGLKADGTVVAVGSNEHGQCDVSGCTDIVAVAAGNSHTVGLKADGTVVAVGDRQNGRSSVSGWTDIVAVAAGNLHTVGLKADGTVVATGSDREGQCDVSGWRDIVAVSSGSWHTVGLKADGTVVAVGDNIYGQLDVSSWRDIVAVVAGGNYTMGLKADSIVVAVGSDGDGQCDVSGWSGIKTPKI